MTRRRCGLRRQGDVLQVFWCLGPFRSDDSDPWNGTRGKNMFFLTFRTGPSVGKHRQNVGTVCIEALGKVVCFVCVFLWSTAYFFVPKRKLCSDHVPSFLTFLYFPSVFCPCFVGWNPVFRQIGPFRIMREMNKVEDELAGRALHQNHTRLVLLWNFCFFCLGTECFGDVLLLLSAVEHRAGLKLRWMQWP